MDRFPKFDMMITVLPQFTMWYNNLDGDRRRTLNKYIGALTELINMNGWSELLDVVMGYWDSQRMVLEFGTTEITPTLEDIRDRIDRVGIGIERKASKQEDIFIPNKPSKEDIADWLGLGKDFA